MASSMVSSGQLIGDRYRLERPLSHGDGSGDSPLWLATDALAADAPVALRRVGPEGDQATSRLLWARLQGVLHPQVPRFGAVITDGDQLWLVREWQGGRTYRELLEARRERQMVFGAGEVLLLLRQFLPVLVALHGQDLVHGDLCPANLLRRDSDGLPVPLDFGLLRQTGGQAGPIGGTPGYVTPEQLQGAEAAPWMDLHALGVVALVLLSGDEPATLLDPVSMNWRWPAALEGEPALQRLLERLVSRDPGTRFTTAGQALAAFQALAMPESTGPVPRADRTVMLVPPPLPPSAATAGPLEEDSVDRSDPRMATASDSEAAPDSGLPGREQDQPTTPSPRAVHPGRPQPVLPALPVETAGPPPPQQAPLRSRQEARDEEAEGGFWPVLLALVLSAVAGTTLGWWWLSRGKPPASSPQPAPTDLPSSLPAAEVDQRQQLLSRLQAMQVDRGWFTSLVDASLLAQYPERKGRLPGEALEDAPLRKVWNELAEEWLARVEQIPLRLRMKLGGFSGKDWERRQADLLKQGLSTEVLQQLVSGSAQNLLPGRAGQDMPAEPFRQLWFASAEQTLENVNIEPIEVRSEVTQMLSADVPANGARLFPIRMPADHALVLGVNGTPLLQMSVFGANGARLAPKGALRVVSLGVQKSSPVQLLVTNEGVAPARISLSLRADPPVPAPRPQEPPTDAPGESPEPTSQPQESEPAKEPSRSSSTPATPDAPAAPLNPPPPVTPPPPVDAVPSGKPTNP